MVWVSTTLNSSESEHTKALLSTEVLKIPTKIPDGIFEIISQDGLVSELKLDGDRSITLNGNHK